MLVAVAASDRSTTSSRAVLVRPCPRAATSTSAAVATGPVKCGAIPTVCVSQIAMIFCISVKPPIVGIVARIQSMSRFSTSSLKVHRCPHCSPGASGTLVIIRSLGIWERNCSSRSGSSTRYGRNSSSALRATWAVPSTLVVTAASNWLAKLRNSL